MSSFVERDAVEVVVATQWFRVLGSTPQSLDANFFDAGGNSLAAARLTTALCKAFKTDLPVQVVFDAQTFRGISNWIRNGVPAAGKRLVTLNDEGAGTPLLLLPSGGGGVIGLQRFGGAPFDRPVFGLQSRGLDPNDGLPFTDLEEMTADFVRVVEDSSLPRTLHLGGYCTGGTFAYELARALRAGEWNILSVSLFNTSLYRRPLDLDRLIHERLAGLASAAGLGDQLPLAASELDVAQVFDALKNKGVDILEADLAAFEARLRVYGSLWTSVTGYRPELQDVPVRLFATADRYHPEDKALMSEDDRDWSELGFRDIRTVPVAVSHREMLRHEPTLDVIERSLAELDPVPSPVAAPPISSSPPMRPVAAADVGTDTLLALGHGEELPAEAPVPVHVSVAEWARTHPDRVAVSSGTTSITYGELDAWADAIAGELASVDVSRGSRVGVLAEPSLAMVAAVLGTLRCGAAYVPVDTAHPDDRISAVLADAEVTAVAVTAATAGREVAPGLPRVTVQHTQSTESRRPASNHDAETPSRTDEMALLNDIAYLIYTSGSTGEPKGVLVGHRQLAASTAARRVVYPGAPVFLLVSPLAFDSSVAGVWGTLTSGGHLVVAAKDEVRDPGLLARLADTHGATHLLCVPSLYAVLLDAAEHLGLESLRFLETVTVAGEALPQSLLDRHFALWRDKVALVNEYGPTEATVWASYARFEAPGPVSIGKPVPGTRLYVLDEALQPQPIGVTGELYIGGAGVTNGYHGRPEATARAFLTDPFADGEDARMYRTGDLVRWNADGTLDFVGRRDHQVKVRGHRIELGAIETQLTAQEGVREAVVVPNEVSTGLIAFVLSDSETTSHALDDRALRTRLAESLPSVMVPERIVSLPAFPRTVNGKVDRAVLLKENLPQTAR
ncbi:amino acid adenylation domain-containing protein [Streptomyces sp. NPDC012508]|uniref:amino acid adenylation domain-containing protein n=1 Tax=Streptomyces sp. NPDC012508 TaxID=3364837 RepID=UPI0036C825DF